MDQPGKARRWAGMIANLSIGRKIVGLSVVVLSLMLAAAIYAFFQSWRVHAANDQLVGTLEPLSHQIAVIEAHEIEEALLVERALRHLGPRLRNRAEGEDAAARMLVLGKDVAHRIDTAETLILRGAAKATRPEIAIGLGQLELQVEEVRREHLDYEAAAMALLGMAAASGEDVARAEAAFVKSEDRLTAALERLAERTTALAAGEEQGLGKLEQRQFLVSFENLTIAILAFISGTLLSALVTRRMLRPVHGLIAATEQIAGGNFEVALPAPTHDEIGRLASAFHAMAAELRSKALIRETFGSYVDPRVVDRLLGDGREALEAGERRDMTVLFADLEGFVHIAEALTPTALVRLVNRYLTLASEPISTHGGVIDKYIGDAVMAYWGAPFSHGDCALAACRTALAQHQEQLATLSRELPELLGLRKAIPAIKFRIGIASGDVVVGSIGSKFSKSFTVIGDPVNLASRLEGASKIYGTSILIDEATAVRVAGAVEVREIDLLTTAGKDEAARIFELLGLAGEVAPERLALRDAYDHALAYYRAQDWDRAEAAFDEALKLAPHDRASRVLLDRIAHFRADPPDEDWGGVWRSLSK